jgi:N-acetyl-gamma-glutamyl-phosphate reductase
MIRVGIVGVTGYTAIESIRWLLNHPQAQITAATSRQGEGSSIDDVHPELEDRLKITVADLKPHQIAQQCDVAFCCLPHGASAGYVMELLAAGCRVIDLSADYRLNDVALYEKWYGEIHPDPGRLLSTPYGLPELFPEQLKGANLIANPGCYPTSAILPLSPLFKNGLIDPETVLVDSKSGVSGAGRTPKLGNLYVEVNESVSAYSVGSHRHQPEMVNIIQRYSGVTPNIVFTPHLMPMERGIFSTIYVRPNSSVSANQVRECLCTFYDQMPFVRVVSHLPATRFVSRTNYCDIAVRESDGWLIILSAIDNLVKGASGAAVQNMNCMFGLDQRMGLLPNIQ